MDENDVRAAAGVVLGEARQPVMERALDGVGGIRLIFAKWRTIGNWTEPASEISGSVMI